MKMILEITFDDSEINLNRNKVLENVIEAMQTQIDSSYNGIAPDGFITERIVISTDDREIAQFINFTGDCRSGKLSEPENFVYNGKTREEIIDALATQDSEVDNIEASMFFSVKEGITGYNSMSKDELIDLCDNYLEDED